MRPGSLCGDEDDDPCPGVLALMRTPGRRWRYRKGGVLVEGQIPEEVETLTCPACGNTYVSMTEAVAIDLALGADKTPLPPRMKGLPRARRTTG